MSKAYMPIMITSIFPHFLLVFLVHLFSHESLSLQASELGPYPTNFTTTCLAAERNALLEFKTGLQDPSGRLSSWVGNDCCAWPGVRCNRQIGHITKLDLRNPHSDDFYYDALDIYLASLRRQVNPSLLVLKYLKYLDLSFNNFEQSPIPNFIGSFSKLGYLNLSYASFVGLVPPHLGNLSNLRYLDLSSSYQYNPALKFQNNLISDLKWISSLSLLKHLDLGGANLSSASTNWVQVVNMLPFLVELHLGNCHLHDIPTFLNIVNFSSIQVIDLSSNDFNSPLPGWLFNITSLVELNLSCNGFSGQIHPSLENLRKMRDLELHQNHLSGALPIFIGNLSSLESLSLYDNQLNGTVPETIGQLKELTLLYLDFNNWEGVVSWIHFLHLKKLKRFSLSSRVGDKSLVFDVGHDWVPPFSLNMIYIVNCRMDLKFPLWLQTQKELTSITLSQLKISDLVPEWFWKLSPQINFLDLSDNKLCGKLPRSLQFALDSSVDLSSNLFEKPIPLFFGVVFFSLRNNLLSGPIPADIGLHMLNLQFLDLSENNLNGSIPSSISELGTLEVLSLQKNKLSGKIFSGKTLMNLVELDLSDNNLSGNIPSSLCSQYESQSQLSYLKLNGNNLYGKLSPLRNCTSLLELSLANNKFSGGIPTWIGESLHWLSILQLRGNRFRGKIPKKLCQLSKLHVIDLGQNKFSGLIPPCLGNLTGLYRLADHSYEDNEFGQWEFRVKGRTLEFVKINSLMNFIDLSSNNLEGEIPEEIMKLSALDTFNLSHNRLTGNIPEKIGDLELLETLDLSVNHLSGPIPTSMVSMTSLSHLNLSHNDLSGPIPLANQFLTFNDPSIYEGNPKLCGAPLPINCSTNKNDTPGGHTGKDKGDQSWSERSWFYIGTASGFIVGFWAVCGTLVIKTSWRRAYFRFMEEMKDKIYVFIVVKAAHLQKKPKGGQRS